MRLGILPELTRFGGVFQYSLTMLDALQTLRRQGLPDELVIFCSRREETTLQEFFREADWRIVHLDDLQVTWKGRLSNLARHLAGEGAFRRALRTRLKTFTSTRRPAPTNPDAVRYQPKLSRAFAQQGVELMLYPSPTTLSFEISIPYVMAVHDLQHRIHPEFPEVSVDGRWEAREYLFRNGIRYATLILVDSEIGKEDVLRFYGSYGITPDRIKLLPFLPAPYLRTKVSETEIHRVRKEYGLPERYLFYPAQFWPHKNHARIVQAIGLLKARFQVEANVIFCGFHSGKILEETFQAVFMLAKKLGIEKQIRYLGYVPDENMSALYAASVGLVMPTFFGPTNIPVVEAWSYGSPVIASDLRGIREQVGEAGILVDPYSAEAIADAIHRIWTDESLRNKLVEQGRKRLAAYTAEDYCTRLKQILEEAKARIKDMGENVQVGRSRDGDR